MQVGRLNQRITIQNYSETQNSFGEVVRTYSTLYSSCLLYTSDAADEAYDV